MYLVLWRLNGTDGSLDASWSDGTCQFGGCLARIGTAGGMHDEADAVAVDSRGRYVVAGFSTDANATPTNQVVVWRYNPDTTLDTEFGRSGYVTLAVPLGLIHADPSGGAMGLYLDEQGRIVVSSYAEDANSLDHLVVWRILP